MNQENSFIKLSSINRLCNDCKPFGYCKYAEKLEQLQLRLLELPKLFSFSDFAKHIPVQSFNGNLGVYTNKHLQIACDAFHQEDYETALLNFKAALEGRANLNYAHLGLALCYFKMNNFEMALIHIEYHCNANWHYGVSTMVQHFRTLCEIGLQELELNKQLQLVHNIETAEFTSKSIEVSLHL